RVCSMSSNNLGASARTICLPDGGSNLIHIERATIQMSASTSQPTFLRINSIAAPFVAARTIKPSSANSSSKMAPMYAYPNTASAPSRNLYSFGLRAESCSRRLTSDSNCSCVIAISDPAVVMSPRFARQSERTGPFESTARQTSESCTRTQPIGKTMRRLVGCRSIDEYFAREDIPESRGRTRAGCQRRAWHIVCLLSSRRHPLRRVRHHGLQHDHHLWGYHARDVRRRREVSR